MAINISTSNQNFVKSKLKYVQAYSNTKDLDKNKKEIFNIKSRLSGNRDIDLIFYLAINFFKFITHTYSKYEIGSSGINVEFEDKKLNKKFVETSDSEGLSSILIDVINKKSIVGYSVVRIKTTEDKKPIIQKIPTPNYFAETDGLDIGSKWNDIKRHFIVNIQTVQEGQETKHYAHIDRYEKNVDGPGRKGYYEVYTFKDSWNFTKDNFVRLKKEEDLPYLPIFVFQNEVFLDEEFSRPSGDKKGDNEYGSTKLFFAESDYDDIFKLVEEINDRLSQVSVELIQNLRSKMAVPQSYKQSKALGGALKANKEKLGLTETESARSKYFKDSDEDFDYIVHGVGEQPAHYITKDNPMIDQAFKTIETCIRLLANQTDIPLSLRGVQEASGNKKVGVDNNEFDSFYTKIEQRRQRIYPTLQRMCHYIGWILNDGKDIKLPTIKFAKLKARDTKDKVDYLATMFADGVLSRETYIETALNLDKTETAEEIKKIEKQEIQTKHITGDFIDNNLQ